MDPAHDGVGHGVVAVERDGSLGGGACLTGDRRSIGPEAIHDGRVERVGQTRMSRREVGVELNGAPEERLRPGVVQPVRCASGRGR